MIHKDLILRALQQHRGDNAARAVAAFRHCTPAEMTAEYGQSGQTRAQLLQGYRDHEAAVDAAIAWVTAQP